MYSLGLEPGVTYYVIRESAITIKLASSLANAMAGTAIDLISTGSGTHTLTLTLSNRSLGSSGGEETHLLTIAEMPSHTHSYGKNNGGSGNATLVGENSDGTTNNSSSAGSNTPHNNMPPYTVVNYIIKT